MSVCLSFFVGLGLGLKTALPPCFSALLTFAAGGHLVVTRILCFRGLFFFIFGVFLRALFFSHRFGAFRYQLLVSDKTLGFIGAYVEWNSSEARDPPTSGELQSLAFQRKNKMETLRVEYADAAEEILVFRRLCCNRARTYLFAFCTCQFA